MSDVVVTVPQALWDEWLDEGDLPGTRWDGTYYTYWCGFSKPPCKPGDRVYIVAYGRLRGFAPLVGLDESRKGYGLVRGGHAQAITIPEPIPGFPGWRSRWWHRNLETAFPDWQTEGVTRPRPLR